MADDIYDDLRQYLPPAQTLSPRKMLSVTQETHDALSKLSKDLQMPRSTIIDALIKYYLDEDAE